MHWLLHRCNLRNTERCFPPATVSERYSELLIKCLLNGQGNIHILVSTWTNILKVNKSGDLKDASVLSRKELRHRKNWGWPLCKHFYFLVEEQVSCWIWIQWLDYEMPLTSKHSLYRKRKMHMQMAMGVDCIILSAGEQRWSVCTLTQNHDLCRGGEFTSRHPKFSQTSQIHTAPDTAERGHWLTWNGCTWKSISNTAANIP